MAFHADYSTGMQGSCQRLNRCIGIQEASIVADFPDKEVRMLLRGRNCCHRSSSIHTRPVEDEIDRRLLPVAHGNGNQEPLSVGRECVGAYIERPFEECAWSSHACE